MTTTELDLIEWIRRSRPAHEPVGGDPVRVETGIGDDCAVLSVGGCHHLLLANDMVMEGVHFDLALTSEDRVGWKALASNLSDLAAMGGRPSVAVVAVAAPRDPAARQIRELYHGIDDLARRFGVRVVGGDLSRSPGPLVVTISVLGWCEHPPARRQGARPGDRILVTGRLGGSSLGHHLDFVPRLVEGQRLVAEHGIRTMIDVSDGLARDLAHLATGSGTGAMVDAARVPVSEAARRLAETDGVAALEHALHDGEDFELLFAASPALAERIREDPHLGEVSDVGEFRSDPGLVVRSSGGEKPLEPGGHDHFA